MRMSEGVEWAIHCTVLLAALPDGASLPAARLAEYHGVPGPYLAKSLQALARSGVVESIPGRRGGYRLARPAKSISLLDVVQAVEGGEPAFRCSHPPLRRPVLYRSGDGPGRRCLASGVGSYNRVQHHPAGHGHGPAPGSS
jgi:Rrf2 family protein